jgi:GNAT superfamily N-acetyltransferase
MRKLIRTNSDNPDFIAIVKMLDADLAIRDGADHAFYAQFNKTNKIRFVLVAYQDEEPVGCGAIRELAMDTMEVKRMFVIPEQRGKGIASAILAELEKWAKEMSFTVCVLETGKRQPEAISLYEHNGYRITENYGQYIGMENSVCFRKELE